MFLMLTIYYGDEEQGAVYLDLDEPGRMYWQSKESPDPSGLLVGLLEAGVDTPDGRVVFPKDDPAAFAAGIVNRAGRSAGFGATEPVQVEDVPRGARWIEADRYRSEG